MNSQPDIILPGNKPAELKNDPLLYRCFFQYVEGWILKEAERREDTWQFLLGVRGLPQGCYDFFRSAESVSKAATKLLLMQYGGATLNRNLLDEIAKASEARRNRLVENFSPVSTE